MEALSKNVLTQNRQCQWRQESKLIPRFNELQDKAAKDYIPSQNQAHSHTPHFLSSYFPMCKTYIHNGTNIGTGL